MVINSRLPYRFFFLPVVLLVVASLTACIKDTTAANGNAPQNMVTDTKTFAVGAGKTMVFYVRAEPKDAIEASFTIQGGDDDIDVYVKDPLNNMAVEKKRATDMSALAFFSNATGYHQIVFDNTFSTNSNKLIWLKINHPGRGGIVP